MAVQFFGNMTSMILFKLIYYFRFEMETNELIEFMKVAVKQQESEKNENMLNRVMPCDNVAIAVVLRIKENIYQNSNFYLKKKNFRWSSFKHSFK